DKFIERGGIYDWKTKKSFPEKLTLSGYVGSGKTTLGKLLAKKLQYNFISIGNRTREFAGNKGMTIVEFQKYCLANPEMDKQLDQDFSKVCNSSENLVIDYRLGFKFIKNSYHIFLRISETAAIERLKTANRAKESYDTINQRNESFKNQFLNSYGVDYTMPKNYDLVIDVERFNNAEEIIEHILHEIG
ncbi:MAG TPA: hypothetical protein EYN89_06605, partial [Flavobacteriales bacterium]|nr:hypothetical protein [Flavobacteriales bacterium]